MAKRLILRGQPSNPITEPGPWLELRNGRDKLQARYNLRTGLLEIQHRGVKTWYPLPAATQGGNHANPPCH